MLPEKVGTNQDLVVVLGTICWVHQLIVSTQPIPITLFSTVWKNAS